MDEALRMNLSDALADGLDKQILAGTEGLFTGTILANHNVSAVTTYANYRSELGYGRVDGTNLPEVRWGSKDRHGRRDLRPCGRRLFRSPPTLAIERRSKT